MGFVFQFLSSLILFVNIARTIAVKEYGKLNLNIYDIDTDFCN